MGAGILEVFADIWCPFAHVGLRTAVRERARLGRDVTAIVVRAWPLELVNGAPLDVEKTLVHIHHLRTQVAPDLFTGFNPTRFPVTTLPALALGIAAYRRSPMVGEQVSLALRDALFEFGLDISDPDVLDEIALEYGVDHRPAWSEESVRDEWRAGQRRGVKGSPHFFCGDRDAFCPSLDFERDSQGELELRRNAQRMHEFLRQCFAA